MKKVLSVIIITIALTGCDNKQENCPSEINAIQYAKENVFNHITGVEAVCITATDSVLTDEMIDDQHFEALAEGMVSGRVSENEFRYALDSIGNTIHDIWKTWEGGHYKAQVEGKYHGNWRTIYTVTATMKSGAEHNTRVLMKKDGITPDMTEDEYRAKQKKKRGVLQAVTHELWYR